jgi:hypothetical protein
VLLTG